ncbi:MAG: CHRD domain-containing protein [Gammaproteobacteria bacterium]
MRKRFFLAAIGIVVLAGLALTTVASTDFDGLRLRTNLRGFEEVPSISTVARGSFRALVSEDGNSIDWTLTYRNLEAAVQQAHIHFGQTGVNGGITVFLCTNLGNGPAGIQTCPASPATITGTIAAADVSPNIAATEGARAQGLGTGEFAELIRAIRSGNTYANVHSATFPGGEVRGQIRAHDDHDD